MKLYFQFSSKPLYVGICATCMHEHVFPKDTSYASVICKQTLDNVIIRKRRREPNHCLNWQSSTGLKFYKKL